MIRCVKICVDCIENDPVDIRCGGPQYLGFDFYVEIDKKDGIIEFIKNKLVELDLPLKKIYCQEEKEISESKVWNSDRICIAIEKYEEDLQRAMIQKRNNQFKVRRA